MERRGWNSNPVTLPKIEKKKPRQTGGHWAGLRGSNGGGTYVMGEGSAPSQL